ncbi:MAG TPA: hypothetical protein EYP04_09530 [Anaerolineae bacterium]|nr:hypothetical protein [Anaerolineae bacterium]HIQ04470.1 hypothetical protein [Anaerolineae bacterium]
MVGGVRIGVPRYDPGGVREAINNALIHRDYTRLGAVHVQLHDDCVLVSNPGGFVVGVTVENLLVVAPRPRNPLLADAFKRVGLVKKTGRGRGGPHYIWIVYDCNRGTSYGLRTPAWPHPT